MLVSLSSKSLGWIIAILLIAILVAPMRANSQNTLENAKTSEQSEKIERDRINRERTAANQELEQQRKACYQKLAVTSCLNEARDTHSEKTRDLKRQEVALNDVQRKRAAAERIRMIDERNSPQAQQALAERRGRALAATAEREKAQADKKSSRQAKEAAAASKPAAQEKGSSQQSQPSGKPRNQPSPKLAPEQRPSQTDKMAKNREQAAAREQALEKRRAEALQREANRKKPAAASLPIPN